MDEIPEQPGGITPAWLTQQLAESFPYAWPIPRQVQRVGSETGFASRIFRVRLEWDPPGRKLPLSIIVKLPAGPDHPAPPEQLSGKYLREAGFYEHFAPDSHEGVPRCYRVAQADGGERFALLLEDLQDATLGDAATGAPLQQLLAAAERLATLHACWWQHPKLNSLAWLRPYGDLAAQLEKLPERREVFLERYGHLLTDTVRERTGQLGPGDLPRLQALAEPPVTLLHADAHLDNFAFRGHGTRQQAILFDWQCASIGRGAVDLVMLCSSLNAEQRRQHESEINARYLRVLHRAGVPEYEEEQLQNDLDLALLRLWIGYVNGFGAPHAGDWSGRQLQLAQIEVSRMNAALSAANGSF